MARVPQIDVGRTQQKALKADGRRTPGPSTTADARWPSVPVWRGFARASSPTEKRHLGCSRRRYVHCKYNNASSSTHVRTPSKDAS